MYNAASIESAFATYNMDIEKEEHVQTKQVSVNNF